MLSLMHSHSSPLQNFEDEFSPLEGENDEGKRSLRVFVIKYFVYYLEIKRL